MRNWVLILLLLFPTVAMADGMSKVGVFQDGFGNVGTFWLLDYEGKTYAVMEIDNREKKGKASITLTEEDLTTLQTQLKKLKQAKNPHKVDGFSTLDNIKTAEASFTTVLARWNGVKVKLIQVVKGENPEQQMVLDKEAYSSINRNIRKVKAKLHPAGQ